MIIEFTVGNYRSFRDRQTFSMEATSLKSAPHQRHLDESNVFEVEPRLSLLTSAALYGANAGGKSNLVRALKFMRDFVINSSRDRQIGDATGVEPFLLSTETENAPSYFEIVFRVDGQRFRYGFEADSKKIVSEWLYQAGERGEKTLFERDVQKIHVNVRNFREGHGLEERTRENALFLSVVAQFNGEITGVILAWFHQLVMVSGWDETEYQGATLRAMDDPERRAEVVRFVRQMDVNITDFVSEEKPFNENMFFILSDPSTISKEQIINRLNSTVSRYKTKHTKFSPEGENISEIEFDLKTQESDGTRKLFYLAGALLQALREGTPMFVDELDARLHPQMTCAIVGLFNDKATNPHGAQLMFTTHDTNLLSTRLFRRDQIWFAEKDDTGGTHLYSLAEYRLNNGSMARNDADLEADYIRGKFGAIPFLGDLRHVVSDIVAHSSNGTHGEANGSKARAEKEQGQAESAA